MGHTPGPWEKRWVGDDGSFEITSHSSRLEPCGKMVIASRQGLPEQLHAEGIANAHLIAASPMMLSALENTKTEICGHCKLYSDCDPDELCGDMDIIREAIAKAKEET